MPEVLSYMYFLHMWWCGVGEGGFKLNITMTFSKKIVWRLPPLVLDTNTVVLEMNTLKTRVRIWATHNIATIDFQTELMLRWLLWTGTYVRKWTVSRSRALVVFEVEENHQIFTHNHWQSHTHCYRHEDAYSNSYTDLAWPCVTTSGMKNIKKLSWY